MEPDVKYWHSSIPSVRTPFGPWPKQSSTPGLAGAGGAVGTGATVVPGDILAAEEADKREIIHSFSARMWRGLPVVWTKFAATQSAAPIPFGEPPTVVLPITHVLHNRGMRVTGTLPEDAPDPRVEQAERLKLMPIPVMGLVSQPSLEDTDAVGLGYSQDARGYCEMTASVTYAIWRNPIDRSDPINLADLDEQTRKAIEEVPP